MYVFVHFCTLPVMPRRKPAEPDTRPDWRDPDMPVLAGAIGQYVDHRKLHQLAIRNLNANPREAPNWRDDPTYDLAKRKRQHR